ncbi:hypothetical protein H0H92_001007 [Tricholoma furcatifolium]|nr:hypothetical protein H0H92_001007 [Tricholoma furcatifolium]
MSPLIPPYPRTMPPPKKIRRTATSVMSGLFDGQPSRDALTSLLNGVRRYKPGEIDEESIRKAERKKKKQLAALAAKKASSSHATGRDAPPATSCPNPRLDLPHAKPSGFWPVDASASTAAKSASARPRIELRTAQRSVSITPPPPSPRRFFSTPGSTPGPSDDSSSTSRTSSKRPRTPDDEEPLPPPPPPPVRGRKKPAVRKGWKGWVEGSPPPSTKLINLDAVPVLQDRRTRSGKSFDAIGIGKESWI